MNILPESFKPTGRPLPSLLLEACRLFPTVPAKHLYIVTELAEQVYLPDGGLWTNDPAAMKAALGMAYTDYVVSLSDEETEALVEEMDAGNPEGFCN